MEGACDGSLKVKESDLWLLVVGPYYRCVPVGPTDILQCMRSYLWAAADRLLGIHVAVSLLLTDNRIAMLCMPCNAEARLGFCLMSFPWA